MLQAEFTLYRFVCDLETFTGLFAEDSEGRHIPDTAAFCCAWARVPRAKVSTMNPVQVEPHGTTSTTYFKSLSADMALTFALDPVSLRVNGDSEVLTFQIRPTQYNGGDIPVVAKGTLDPVPYFGKPRKNYAVKLRDASSQAIGKLIFNLAVTELDAEDTEEVRRVARESQSATRASQAGTPSRPPPPRSSTGSRNPSVDHSPVRHFTTPMVTTSASKTPPRTSADRTPPKQPPSHQVWQAQEQEGNSPLPTAPKVVLASAAATAGSTASAKAAAHSEATRNSAAVPPTTASSAKQKTSTDRQLLTHAQPQSPPHAPPMLESLHVVFERVSVKPEEVQMDRPAPFIIGATYTVKLRHGTSAYSTANMTCTRGREVPLLEQQTRLSLLAAGEEKLRFSLWENGKQVAGFSLAIDKFCNAVGQPKPYTIPFRYHPTNQGCALDVTVQRLQTPLEPTVLATYPAAPVAVQLPTAPPPSTTTITQAAGPSAPAVAAPAPAEAPREPVNAKISPVKVLHRWAATDAPTPPSAGRGFTPVTAAAATRERSASSPAPHHPRSGHVSAAVAPHIVAPAPPSAPAHHTRLSYQEALSDTRSDPFSVADTVMELRVVEVAPRPAPVRTQPYVPSLAGPSMWAANEAQLRSEDSRHHTPLRQRVEMTDNAAVAFPVETLAVPRIIPDSRRAHSRDPSFTALGLPSEPQHADPFAQGRGTPVRSFLPRASDSREHSRNSTPVASTSHADSRRTQARGDGGRVGGQAHAHASSRPPQTADPAEKHMSAVLARLDALREERNRTPLFDRRPSAQADAGPSRPSLLSDWQQWRSSRHGSLDGSMNSPYDPRRSLSVHSAMSRDDSVASVSSRRCSPLPTKSFATQAELRPVQTVVTDDDALTRYRRHRGAAP